MTDLTASRVKHYNTLLFVIMMNMFAGVLAVLSLMADSLIPVIVSSVLALEFFIVGNLIGVVIEGKRHDGYCRRIVEVVKEYPDPPHKELEEERDADV